MRIEHTVVLEFAELQRVGEIRVHDRVLRKMMDEYPDIRETVLYYAKHGVNIGDA